MLPLAFTVKPEIYMHVSFLTKNVKEKVCVYAIESIVLLSQFVCIVCDTGTLWPVLHTQVPVACTQKQSLGATPQTLN